MLLEYLEGKRPLTVNRPGAIFPTAMRHATCPLDAPDYALRRLDELYRRQAYADADRLADQVVEHYRSTDTAARVLWTRSLYRRKRGDHEGALWDLLDAADQGTGEWALRSAFRAGVHCSMLDWDDRARVVFENVVAKWPLTTTAARAAAELAWIHRGTEKQEYWENIQVDILHRLVCDPNSGTDDDLDALQQAVEHYLERPEEGEPPRDVERATSCAQELLARATDRKKSDYVEEAELAVIAIETNRPLNLVWTLAAEGDDPRLPHAAAN